MVGKKEFNAINTDFFLHGNKEIERFYQKLSKDPHQLDYYNAIMENRMVMLDEPSGTGKTTVAIKAGLDLLKSGKVNRIVYIRFPSKRGEGLGATTGDLKEKEAKYMKPFYQCLIKDFGFTPEAIEAFIEEGLLETTTDASERGITRDKEFAIIDESQNAIDLPQLNLTLSRFTDESKVCLIGHSKQTDNKNVLYTQLKLNAFQMYQYHYLKKRWAKKIKLVKNYRGELSRWSDEVYTSVKEINTELTDHTLLSQLSLD
jgi:phosphate starvation-inducible protein PhoH